MRGKFYLIAFGVLLACILPVAAFFVGAEAKTVLPILFLQFFLVGGLGVVVAKTVLPKKRPDVWALVAGYALGKAAWIAIFVL